VTKIRKNLSSAAQSVQDVLSRKGLQAEVVELPSSTRTAEEAAQSIGCDVSQIVKSLIFVTKETHQPILVLASGPNRVNEKTIAGHIGEKVVKADADFARQVTGFAIGGIPPIGHKQSLVTLIDEDLLRHPTVWAAAGTPRAIFSIASSVLSSLTEGKVISVK